MKIGFCGYSYHNYAYNTSHQSRYVSYLFRLQIDGTAQVKVGGKEHPIEKGDLLIVKPNETYELYVGEQQKKVEIFTYIVRGNGSINVSGMHQPSQRYT